MSVLDLAFCPICRARDSLARQTMQFESRTHVTYECLACGTLLAWLGDEMWLEADRWSFQRVGRPEKADLLYRSMTVAELRKLAGEKPPAPTVLPGEEPGQPKPPPVWVEIPQAKKTVQPAATGPATEPEPLPDDVTPVEVERETVPVEAAPVFVELEPEPEPQPDEVAPVVVEPEPATEPAAELSAQPSPEPEPLPDDVGPVKVEREAAPVEAAPVVVEPEPATGPVAELSAQPSPEPEPLPDDVGPVEVEREAAPVEAAPVVVELEPEPEPQPDEVAPVVVGPEPTTEPAAQPIPELEPLPDDVGPVEMERETVPVEAAPVVVKLEPAAEPSAQPIPELEPLPDTAAQLEVERAAELVEETPVEAEPAAVEERPASEPTPAVAPVEVVPAEAEPEPLPMEVAPIAPEVAPHPAEVEHAAIGEVGWGEEPSVDRPLSKQRRSEAQTGPQRRRSRGSPFLVISVGLVLLCLICSAAAMVVYSLIGSWPLAGGLPTNPPASEAIPSETLVPTDALLITDTPAPTETAVPSGEVGVPEARDDVEFQGVTAYQSSSGSHYLVGEVLNRTADTLRFVEVLATFYGEGGQIVGTGSTFAELSTIDPGSTAPFKLTAPNVPELGRYELQVAYSVTSQPPIRLELVGHSGALDSGGWYRITGEVRNPHDFAVRFPEVVATYYNATHQVVRVEVAFGQVDPLEPGQSSPFELVLTDAPADLQHYALQTEAAQQ